LQDDAALASHSNAARGYRLLKFSSRLSSIEALTGRDAVRWSGGHEINPQQASLTVCSVAGETSRTLGNGRWLPNHDNFWIADNTLFGGLVPERLRRMRTEEIPAPIANMPPEPEQCSLA
jgi:hypothetical protein